jgi:hypothetical protein
MLMPIVNRHEHTHSLTWVLEIIQTHVKMSHYFQHTENPKVMQAEHTHKFT